MLLLDFGVFHINRPTRSLRRFWSQSHQTWFLAFAYVWSQAVRLDCWLLSIVLGQAKPPLPGIPTSI